MSSRTKKPVTPPVTTSATVHKPVLVNDVIAYLNVRPGGVYLDATFGSGGHTRAILEQNDDCTVIALDWDQRSLDQFVDPLQEEFHYRIRPLWGNFADLYKIFKEQKLSPVDGIIADFGTSQMQIFDRPGFSVYRHTPLDMRMAPSFQKVTAAHVLNKDPGEKLQEIFSQLGGERYARAIAQRIVQERKRRKISTTTDLVRIIEQVVGRGKQRIHPATRVFQALRIYVNRELSNIEAFLPAALTCLAPKGRLVCISFHSLEDRIVKEFFREQALAGQVNLLTKKAVRATKEEQRENRSARSARLRAVEMINKRDRKGRI